ncbi:MAG: hypothetical protein FWC41_13725 [Firmicutes bacterium]|nr:hypothetical protein [Bacillota bacterium]
MISLKNKLFNRILSLFVMVTFLLSQTMISAQKNETIIDDDYAYLEAENIAYEDEENATDLDSGMQLHPQQVQKL